MTDGTERYSNEEPPETITLELPVWMVKQLRGTARHEKNNWLTEGGKEDAERIEALLTHYLEQHSQDTGTDRPSFAKTANEILGLLIEQPDGYEERVEELQKRAKENGVMEDAPGAARFNHSLQTGTCRSEENHD